MGFKKGLNSLKRILGVYKTIIRGPKTGYIIQQKRHPQTVYVIEKEIPKTVYVIL